MECPIVSPLKSAVIGFEMSIRTLVRKFARSLQRFVRVLILNRKDDDFSLTDSILHTAALGLRTDFLSQRYRLFRILVGDNDFKSLRSEKAGEGAKGRRVSPIIRAVPISFMQVPSIQQIASGRYQEAAHASS